MNAKQDIINFYKNLITGKACLGEVKLFRTVQFGYKYLSPHAYRVFDQLHLHGFFACRRIYKYDYRTIASEHPVHGGKFMEPWGLKGKVLKRIAHDLGLWYCDTILAVNEQSVCPAGMIVRLNSLI